jgi:hypothetical protein
MVTRRSIGGAVFNILILYVCADAQLVFPHVAQGDGYQTTFTLTNLTGTAATATIEIIHSSGVTLNRLAVPLVANGTGKASLSNTGVTVGWARVTTSPVVQISGSEMIQVVSGSTVIAEANVLPSQPDTVLQFPTTDREGITTGFAVANPGAQSTTITLSLRNQIGGVAASQVISLGPLQHLARFVSEIFHGIGGFEGSLEISSTSGIAALALRQYSSGIFSILPTAAPPAIESFFSPNGGIAARIVQEIQRAQRSIDIAIYSFTLDDIANALILARSRGVTVRIIADSQQAPGQGSQIARLEAAGFLLKRTTGLQGGIMDNKYAIFDSQVLLTGSYNWLTSAETSNSENAVFIHDAPTVDAYQANFNNLWNGH